MSDQRTISPAKGRRVRHEDGALLEPRSEVSWSPYWQRRQDDGDITVHVRAPEDQTAGKDAGEDKDS